MTGLIRHLYLILFLSLTVMPDDVLKAEDGYRLWLRYDKISDPAVLEEICYKYHEGVNSVRWLQEQWEKTKDVVDNERFESVKSLLVKQMRDAKIWRDGCILYFQTFSKKPLPQGLEKPEFTLDYYKNHRYTDVTGIK